MQRKLKNNFLGILTLTFVSIVILLSGCWGDNIDTPYYNQITSYYCGAASAQMILNSEDLGIFVPSQHTIYNYISTHNYDPSGWYTDPKGLRDVLNYYANPTAYFVYSAQTNQDSAVNTLAYTIDRYDVPPAVLINDFAHWVVVRGVLTDVQPTANPSYMVYGFIVNDPGYWASALGENTYIDIDEWKTNYFTTGYWSGAPGSAKYISVVDPKPVPKRVLSYPKKHERRSYMLDSWEIYRQAETMLEKFKNDKRFMQFFEKSRSLLLSARNSEPMLVQRSDQKEEAYYIVPIVNDDLRYKTGKETVGAIVFDAYSGALKEVSLLSQPIAYEQYFQKELAAEKFLSKENIANLGLRGKVEISDMQLVWQSSPEGSKVYYPYWQVNAQVEGEKYQRAIGYLDFEGKVLINLPSSYLLKPGLGR